MFDSMDFNKMYNWLDLSQFVFGRDSLAGQLTCSVGIPIGNMYIWVWEKNRGNPVMNKEMFFKPKCSTDLH